MPADLDSLFWPEVGEPDESVLNELISEHMVLDDPGRLAKVIDHFCRETGVGMHKMESLVEKQRNLRKIVPAVLSREIETAELINIELALEWLLK